MHVFHISLMIFLITTFSNSLANSIDAQIYSGSSIEDSSKQREEYSVPYAQHHRRHQNKRRGLRSVQRYMGDALSTCQLQLQCAGEEPGSNIRLPVVDARGPIGPRGLPGLRGPPGPQGESAKVSNFPPVTNTVKVAFFAGLGTNIIQKPLKSSKVVFENIITNEGKAYDTTTGVFTAPVTGIYSFFIAISAQGSRKAAVSLVHNQIHILDIWCESLPWSTATNQAVLKMALGDEVWVQYRDSINKTDLFYLHGYMYSTMSGFLVHQL